MIQVKNAWFLVEYFQFILKWILVKNLVSKKKVRKSNRKMNEEKKIVLVTGGTGLIGSAIKHTVESESKDNEIFHFVSSKDADLT